MDNNHSRNLTQPKRSKNINVKKPNHENKERRTGEAKFKEAQMKLQLLVQKHLEDKSISSDEEEELETNSILGSVIKNYSQYGGKNEDLERTQNFLENVFHSGAAACLICIETVKRNDPIWSCSSCFGFFHLLCIQRWAKDSIAHQKLAIDERPGIGRNNILWQCPKCRKDYDQTSVPNAYFCFCGQKHDPEFQPWLVPHSCGEVCNKNLSPSCGHCCLLLCHPGPCPPCPKTIAVSCYCKKGGRKTVRCSEKNWSCGAICGKILQCQQHSCPEVCHLGHCPPCGKTSLVSCHCGAEKSLRLCTQLQWHCNKVCGKPLSCGKHVCEKVCHKDECGDCPRSLPRTCPCGRNTLIIPCVDDVMTCGETCGKLCEAGVHVCSQRCHRGACPMCLEVVVKTCQCGLRQKEVSCHHKVYLCDAKCKRMRDCNIHPCNRKCCDGNCPPCERPCGKTLSCGNHKCSSVCHRGPCYPCNVVKELSCKCRSTIVMVPCGAARRTNPPRCNKPCKNPPKCDHLKREEHKCHFGDCPPCRLICGIKKECGHSCPEICHTALYLPKEDYKAATPWDVVNTPYEFKRLPCPRCEVPIEVPCFGEHLILKLPCYRAKQQACGQECGRQLQCSNHVCTLICHVVKNASSKTTSGSNCEECSQDCSIQRSCGHPCPLPCHPGDCDPCKAILKIRCLCGLTQLFVNCNDWTSAEEKEALQSCGNRCPKNYRCGHRCIAQCHRGECPPTPCRKKVKVTCDCHRLKKELPCHLSCQLSCDDICNQLKAEKLIKEETEREMKRLAEENKNKEELMKYQKRMQGGKRRDRRKGKNINEESWLSANLMMLTGVSIFTMSVIIGLYYAIYL